MGEIKTLKDYYPDLIVTELETDDHIQIALRVSNGKPGGVIFRIDTMGMDETKKRFPYPAGDIHVNFEAGDSAYIADTGTLKSFIEVMGRLCARVKVASEDAFCSGPADVWNIE